jgi:hypothetical protein
MLGDRNIPTRQRLILGVNNVAKLLTQRIASGPQALRPPLAHASTALHD